MKGEPVFLSKFKFCLGELGTLPGYHHITMVPSIKPIINPPCKVPNAFKLRLKQELQRITQLDINCSSQWSNRLCFFSSSDRKAQWQPVSLFRVSNFYQAIIREHDRLPTATDIFQEMAGVHYFTKLDTLNALCQIRVDEKSFKLFTNSPCGLFRFLRIPYGIHSAIELCQARIAKIIESIEGCGNVQDDIILWEDTLELTEKRTTKVLQAVRRSGLKLDRAKCQLIQRLLIFLRLTIFNTGIAPDARKIKAITHMPEPTRITYRVKFLQNFSTKRASLRLLLEKDTTWSFNKP